MRSAKALVLELLSAAPDTTVSVAGLVRAAALFGIADNNLRVTLARLKRARLLESAGRGHYRLAGEARAVQRQVSAWRSADKQLCRWRGAWVAVHSGDWTRSDRSALRRRTRALRLTGFRQLREGLWLRPDNLRGGVAGVRTKLHALGLDQRSLVCRVSELDDQDGAAALSLWDASALNETYRSMHRALCATERELDSLPLAEAARRAFVLGGDAIRHIVIDPMLPAPIVDAEARALFIESMRRFDERGRELWTELLVTEEAHAA